MANLKFFEELIYVRNKYGLSQAEFAAVLGFESKQTVSNWENGVRKPPEFLKRICKILLRLPFDRGDNLLILFAQIASKPVPPRYLLIRPELRIWRKGDSRPPTYDGKDYDKISEIKYGKSMPNEMDWY